MKYSLDKVIVALDYEEPSQAFALVDDIGDKIQWYKVGPVLFTRSGTEVIKFLQKRSKKIFLDLKIHDTPIVVGKTVKQFGDMGVQFATVHCLGGKEMLESASHACRGSTLKLLGLTLLTSHHAAAAKEFGWTMSSDELIFKLVDLALQTRLSGIICSPHEIAKVKPRVVAGFDLVTPGIRLPGEEVFEDDQKRFASPKEAFNWGADFVVIGRPITQAREPLEVIQRLFT